MKTGTFHAGNVFSPPTSNAIPLRISYFRSFLTFSSHSIHSSHSLSICCSSATTKPSDANPTVASEILLEARDSMICGSHRICNVEVRNSIIPLLRFPPLKFSLSDQAFFLLAFMACTTSVSFISFVIAAVPTLQAMGRVASSFEKLANTASVELPSTMAALRLSSLEISDLTLELNDLSQEVTDGIQRSAEAVKAVEAGIRHIGARARNHTIEMIEERANLPVISLQPAAAGAAKKVSGAVVRATKTLMGIIFENERFWGRE